jgi:hypothetical protein
MATLGSSSAPSQNTVNYDALLSTTLSAYRDTMVDNIFKDSAYLAFLRESGIEKQDGGERIAQPLMYGSNSTIKSYAGEEVLNTTLQDGMTTAFYEWKEIAGTIGITRKESRQNSGEAQITNLLQKKVVQAEMGMREELNRQLVAGTVSSATFVPGNSAKDMYPLGYFLRKVNSTNPRLAVTSGISRRVRPTKQVLLGGFTKLLRRRVVRKTRVMRLRSLQRLTRV